MLKFSRQWKLIGMDTFAGEPYHIQSCFTEAGALRVARRRLRELEKTQPTAQSGGQTPDGIQDGLYIVRPDGSQYRFTG